MTSEPQIMEIGFPGGLRVEARFRGHLIPTDQPLQAGGESSAPPPFDLFLASIGTCVGYYVLAFCRRRGIETEGLGVTLEPVRGEEKGRFAELRIGIRLPGGFPEKYREAVSRAAEGCTVKKHIVEPPVFRLRLE